MQKYFLYSRKWIGRLPLRYDLSVYSPIVDELNELIQRGVEHGFLQFFDRLETSFNRMTNYSMQEDQNLQSQMISMENIWIYVYFFLLANCFNFVVFLCEHLVFHRKKIYRTLSAAFRIFRNAIAFCWMQFLTNLRALIRSIMIAFQTSMSTIRDILLNWLN